MGHTFDKLTRGLVALCFVLLLAGGAQAADLGVAGVPVALGKSRDYYGIFAALRDAGVTVYFPTSQYLEQPTPKALGTETDFLAPCSPDSPAFDALRRSGMRLVISGDLLYPRGSDLPPLSRDPLRQIIDCAGRDFVYGVLSYDEPVSTGATLDNVSELFDRVKKIDPTLPVLMVHAPIILDMPEFATLDGQTGYLKKVKSYSRFADVVGFDVYPVIKEITKVGTPSSEGAFADHATAIRDYMRWLRSSIPDRGYFMVLQGFSYVDQFEPDFLRSIASDEVLATVRAPNLKETMEMAQLSIDGGAELLVWWGVSFQKDETSQIWRDILRTTRAISDAP
jgi:hypothetical protein